MTMLGDEFRCEGCGKISTLLVHGLCEDCYFDEDDEDDVGEFDED